MLFDKSVRDKKKSVKSACKSKKPVKAAESYGWVVDDNEAWEAYEFACEYFGKDNLDDQIVTSLGVDELASSLAFIFRMNDFREWEQYKDGTLGEEDIEESVRSKGRKPVKASKLRKGKNRKSITAARLTIDFGKFKPWSGAVDTWRTLEEYDKIDVLLLGDHVGNGECRGCRGGSVSLVLGDGVVVLHRHILDLDGEKFTVLAAFCKHLFGGEGVHVKLHDAAGDKAYDGVAHTDEKFLERLDVKGLGITLRALKLKQTLGAVSVGHYAVLVEGKLGGRCHPCLLFRIVRVGNLVSVKDSVKAIDDVEKACSAAVDNARILKDGEYLGCSFNRCVHLSCEVCKQGADGAVFVNAGYCVLDRLSCNGKNGSLSGGHYR